MAQERDPRPTDVGTGEPARGVSRRRFLGLSGAGVLSGAGMLAAGAGSGFVAGRATDGGGAGSRVHPFYGRRQAGIATPVQDRLHFAAFDVTTDSRHELITLLTDWTAMAAQLSRGEPAGEYGALGGPYASPPDDTGEALGLPAAGLTLTFGFGRSLFTDARGRDRFGLAASRPAALVELPHFPGDDLDPARCGGDVCIQACADDPQVAEHAIRNLARVAFGRASLRWAQLGFGRTSSTSTAQQTPRNLFGFKDGTDNLKAEESDELADHVWVAEGDDPNADWMSGGSYLVVRRISMHVEIWDRSSLREQESLVGRSKGEGAPLSGGSEFSAPDFSAMGGNGKPLIPMDSHVRQAHPAQNNGVQILRRSYNFSDGADRLGRMDAGLFFLAYVRDPVTQYIPLQNQLAVKDSMSVEYLEHRGSALFAVPPGCRAGEPHIGAQLFA